MQYSLFNFPDSFLAYDFCYERAAEGALPRLTMCEQSLLALSDGDALRRAYAVLESARVQTRTGNLCAHPVSLTQARTGRRIPVTAEQLRNIITQGNAD